MRRATQTWAESLVRFLTHPVVSSLLMTIGILGIMVEIRTPGFGVPGPLGAASLALFFWGHWLVRLAGWEELLLVGVGLLLLAIEVFVTPGFGLTGVLGLAALIGGLGLSLVGAGATWGWWSPPSGRSRRRSYWPSRCPWPCCVFSRASRSAAGWSSRPS